MADNNVKVVPNVTVIYQDGSGKQTAPGCLEIITMLIVLAGLVLMFGWFK